MKRISYSAPEAIVLGMETELALLTVSDLDVSIDISLGEGDGYGPVTGGYDGNWN